MLMKYGADEFGYVTGRQKATIAFVYQSMRIQMSIEIPDRDEPRFTETPARGTKRSQTQAFNEWQKEVRRRWRALCCVIKGLLVGIDDGVLKFAEAFMPWVVWPDGLTTSEHVLPKLAAAIESGNGITSLNQLPLLTEGN